MQKEKQIGKLYERATFTKILHQDHVLEVLDEAKEGWMIIEDFRFNERGKGYISQDEARQAWFKKWFGE
jgi:hypothetical protein